MERGNTRATSERWDKDIHPSNRFDARWAHPWWDVQSFQKNPGYQANKVVAEKSAKELEDKWIPMFKGKGWIKPGDTQIEDKLKVFKAALDDHENFVKKVNGLGDYLAVPISREDKIEKYLPLMKEGGAGIDKMMGEIRNIRHSMIIIAADSEVKQAIKDIDLVNKQPDPEAELYKNMTNEANKVPEPMRRKQEAKVARWNQEYKRSRSKED